MHTKSKYFKTANQKRKEELLGYDAFALMLSYLANEITLSQYLDKIHELGNLRILNKNELHSGNMKNVKYEAYLMFHGKNEDEVRNIKSRATKFLALKL